MPLQAELSVQQRVLPRRRRRWPGRLGLGAVVAPVLLLALAQAVLPTLAVDRARNRASRYGHIDSVSISAWPAVELLWGKADSASVHAQSLSFSPAQMASMLWEARGVDSMTMTADSATLKVPSLPNGLTLANVTMHKRGAEVRTSGTVSQAQLDAALPGGFRVEPVSSGPSGVLMRASGGLFGARASLLALVDVSGGQLVAQPQGLPFAALARVVLLADPHLRVTSIGLTVTSHQPLVYQLSLTIRLV